MSKQFKLTLTHKAILIAAIPLILGVSFVGVLTYLLYQAEADFREEHRNAMLYADLHQGVADLVQGFGCLSSYGFGGESIALDSRYNDCKLEFQRSVARAQ